ncbi:MAG: hypothetical protein L0Y72_08180 [Gemmataceae bacterium]|nr:hypothetical protein [Gemmataceae bacterium]MCI0739006.1 hypothetical protein [Gemmataceae bacterium]
MDDDALAMAGKQGFSRGFAFPDFALQMATLDRLVEETARKPAPAVPDNQQYSTDPFLADTWTKTANGKVLQRNEDLAGREEVPYFLFFNPNPVASAWGKTGKQIRELFDLKGWQGLTVPEYFVLQRYFCELFGDHRFFETSDTPHLGHMLWLIDSMMGNECSVVKARAQGMNVQAAPTNNRDSRRGAVAGMVVPMNPQMNADERR